MIYKTFSTKDTRKLAAIFAEEVLKTKTDKNAIVIALKGELGAGKTSFIQGFVAAAGVKRRVLSPTFIIVKRFCFKNPRFKNIYHIDAYRLKKTQELTVLGFKDIISDPQNIVLIEWADKVRRVIPRGAFWFLFRHGKRVNERIIEIKKP
jgi:tRNA threonylcarbamoyladenosine biosynthesis protein TsaE